MFYSGRWCQAGKERGYYDYACIPHDVKLPQLDQMLRHMLTIHRSNARLSNNTRHKPHLPPLENGADVGPTYVRASLPPPLHRCSYAPLACCMKQRAGFLTLRTLPLRKAWVATTHILPARCGSTCCRASYTASTVPRKRRSQLFFFFSFSFLRVLNTGGFFCSFWRCTHLHDTPIHVRQPRKTKNSVSLAPNRRQTTLDCGWLAALPAPPDRWGKPFLKTHSWIREHTHMNVVCAHAAGRRGGGQIYNVCTDNE